MNRKSRMCICKVCGKEIGRNYIERHFKQEHKEEYTKLFGEPGFGAVGLRGESRWWMFGNPRIGEIT